MNKYTQLVYTSFQEYCESEKIFDKDINYKSIGKTFVDMHEELINKLDTSAKEELEMLLNKFSDLNEKHNEITFEYGFKFVVNLMLEIFTDISK